MKYKVEITDQAKNEAEFIFKWIEQDSPSNAISWYNDLVVLIESLDEWPLRCPVAPESESIRQEIRCLLHGSYRILYVVKESVVIVLHIRHGAQNFFR